MRGLMLSLVLMLAACAPMTAPPSAAAPPAADGLDAIAADYVALILEIGEHEPGYVDAYYGPPEWAQAAKDNLRPVPELIAASRGLTGRLNAIAPAGLDPDHRQRRAYLLAHVSAAEARLRMLSGEKMGFADEAYALFGVRPDLAPLSSFDPVLARIETLVPGEGPLADRVAAFRGTFAIPKDRLDAVMRAAIAECRARTVRRIPLPANERFTLEFVTDKAWSGYNYYKGDANSLIQINTDLPIFIDRAVDLGCHEGYPGHHVFNLLLERTFVRERGWVEMSVYPLYMLTAYRRRRAYRDAARGVGLAGGSNAHTVLEDLHYVRRFESIEKQVHPTGVPPAIHGHRPVAHAGGRGPRGLRPKIHSGEGSAGCGGQRHGMA